MPPVLDLEATDVSEVSWETLAGQLDPDFTVEDYTSRCSSCLGQCYDCGMTFFAPETQQPA